jgi:hypothetical protein
MLDRIAQIGNIPNNNHKLDAGDPKVNDLTRDVDPPGSWSFYNILGNCIILETAFISFTRQDKVGHRENNRTCAQQRGRCYVRIWEFNIGFRPFCLCIFIAYCR